MRYCGQWQIYAFDTIENAAAMSWPGADLVLGNDGEMRRPLAAIIALRN